MRAVTTIRRIRLARAAATRGGQTLVEFALVLPIFFLLLFGVIDMGRFVYMNSTLSQAAREAARVGAVEASWIGRSGPAHPNCNQVGGPICPANVAALKADMLAAANRMMTPFGSIAAADFYTSCDVPPAPTPVTTQTCATTDATAGPVVSVRVVLVFRPITPMVSQMFSSITTSGSATMVIN
jgi:Flp pilus assembly protein TadG